jgi:hypothetical protein
VRRGHRALEAEGPGEQPERAGGTEPDPVAALARASWRGAPQDVRHRQHERRRVAGDRERLAASKAARPFQEGA